MWRPWSNFAENDTGELRAFEPRFEHMEDQDVDDGIEEIDIEEIDSTAENEATGNYSDFIA